MRWLWVFALGFLVSACVTREQAQEQAHKAYLAGQHDALRRMQQVATSDAVTIQGPVMNSVIPWYPELTLTQAIVAAEYAAERDPVEILVVRGGIAYRYEPAQLLSGRDVPLEPGDLIYLNLSPAGTPLN